METRTMRNFGIRNFAVILAYIVLLCTVTAVSAGEFMSDVLDEVTKLQKPFGNASSVDDEDFKKCKICGHSYEGPQENIINGDPVAPPNKYPWMVQVTAKGSHLCGGVILDGYHILTAAHCLNRGNCSAQQQPCKNSNNHFGIKLLTSKSKEYTEGPPVEGIFVHPEYRSQERNNDIGIVKLKNPITCNSFASPICLPPPNVTIPPKSMFITAGWGRSVPREEKYLSSTASKPLLEAKIMVKNYTNCAEEYHCVIGTEGKISCFGDSGGPMFYKDEVYHTIGIMSVGTDSYCKPNRKQMYTDVSQYLPYIKNITGLQSEHEI